MVVWVLFPTDQDCKKTLKNPFLVLSKMAPIPSWATRDCKKRRQRQDGIGALRDDHGGVGRRVQYVARGGEPDQASGAGFTGARGALNACGKTRSISEVSQRGAEQIQRLWKTERKKTRPLPTQQKDSVERSGQVRTTAAQAVVVSGRFCVAGRRWSLATGTSCPPTHGKSSGEQG